MRERATASHSEYKHVEQPLVRNCLLKNYGGYNVQVRIAGLEQNPPTKPIYHYTSLSGFLGIVRTGQLWASNIHYLNDAAEFNHTLDLAKAELQNAQSGTDSAKRTFLEEIIQMLSRVSKINIFVASFSEKGDLLSQWRAYCGEGPGVAIGFDASSFLQSLQQQRFFLAKCEYNPALQKKIIRGYVEGILAKFQQDCGDSLQQEQLKWNIVKAIAGVAPALKHSAFAEEAEWRVISLPIELDHPQIQFRAGKSTVVPYFELELAADSKALPITKVFVGPNPQMEQSISAVADALVKHGISGSVVRSSIPYRNW